jgi:hypothetical protein
MHEGKQQSFSTWNGKMLELNASAPVLVSVLNTAAGVTFYDMEVIVEPPRMALRRVT